MLGKVSLEQFIFHNSMLDRVRLGLAEHILNHRFQHSTRPIVMGQ